MKTLTPLLISVSLLACTLLRAQAPPSDPIAENFFPPELVMQQQQAIRLSDEQRSFIEAAVQKAQARAPELERQLNEAVQGLAAVTKPERIDEEKLAAQSEKVLALEGKLRQTHLGLMAAIKNTLTPPQQAMLREAKSRLSTLQPKMQKVQAGVERWQQDSRDPSPVVEVMQDFEPLMKEGKFKEAEAVLDRALERLSEKEQK
ncbi:MAG: hypothetical protein HYY24_13345 [Verrucomicrobia bacterium]|nr:hypothetical protein [Verrucomicrobiota bacterium]